MRLRHKLVGATVLAVLLGAGTHAGVAQSVPPPTAEKLDEWQTRMARVPHPAGHSCFTAAYPRLVWREAECATTRQPIPMTPRRGPRPLVVGNGTDISAGAPDGTIISEAIGTFENVTNVTSVTSPIGNSGPPVANAYTLQMNTNYFASPACAGSPNPLCEGWEQFVFANDGLQGGVFIQYWLLEYNAACPAGGWNQFQFVGDPSIYCYKNGPEVEPVPNQPITNLANLRLTGKATAAGDSVTLFDGVKAYSAAGSNAVGAAGGWTIAEFNVFGYGGNSNGGGMATFNADASVHVRTRINFGGREKPKCVANGFTGETNNLNFGTPKPLPTPPGPAVIFLENSTGGAVMDCDAAEVVGDTHQHTFGGLLYDFQASGDFVEAQVGSDFEVQTRKASGAPTWPDTSVNRSVATRMGRTEVALCDGKALVVDGRPAELATGATMYLPTSGVTIHRVGNVYFVIDDKGNSIRVTANNGYTDVHVGLGTWPTTVRGLLGNPGDDATRLEARDGTQFTVPVSFQDLYSRFGDSWRVDPMRTLLAPCEPVVPGNPSAPFFADDLDPEVRERAEGVCLQARVEQAWLAACALDVAVLGAQAAAVYVGLEPPTVNGNG